MWGHQNSGLHVWCRGGLPVALLATIRNTSLRIKDECLIFTTAKICSKVNKLTRQKKRNQNLPLTQTLKHRLSSTCHCEFFISVFPVSREGGWEFHPFLRAALGRAVLWVWPFGTGTSCVPGSSGHAFGTTAALGKIRHVDLCAFFTIF